MREKAAGHRERPVDPVGGFDGREKALPVSTVCECWTGLLFRAALPHPIPLPLGKGATRTRSDLPLRRVEAAFSPEGWQNFAGGNTPGSPAKDPSTPAGVREVENQPPATAGLACWSPCRWLFRQNPIDSKPLRPELLPQKFTFYLKWFTSELRKFT